MLLNKIPVLDNGYVALVSSTCPYTIHKDIVDEFFKGQDTLSMKKMCYAVMVIKAPVFMLMHLAQAGLTIVPTKINDGDAYKPSVGEIGSSNHETNRLISDDIERTTEALLINPKAYQADGCDSFISQVLMPVSTYSTYLVSGTLETWQKFYRTKNSPIPVKSYLSAIEQIIKVEWKNA